MSRTNRSFSHSNGQRKPSVAETSLFILQRDVDSYTHKLEVERKKAFASEAQLEDLKKEMEARKTRIRQLKRISEEAKNRRASAGLIFLRKQSQNNKKQYNCILDEINQIKEQINKLRKERSSFMEEFVQAEQELSFLSLQAEEINKGNEARREDDVDKQMKMLELQEKNNQNMSNYENQFHYMKDTFLRRKLVTDRDQSYMQIPREEDNVYEALDTMHVLKNRLKKLIFRNKNKVKILDEYMRNLTVIDDGFNQIKEQSGVTDIYEIENTFIKSEEQNHQLLTYSDLLNQQIDTLQDVTKDVQKKIQEQEKENQLRIQILHSVPDEDKFKASVQNILNSKQVPISLFQQKLDSILPQLEELLLALSRSEFNTQMPYKMFEYQNGILLNESTVDVYLSDMQSYIIELLKFIAAKNEIPHTYTSALLIEDIPEKQFKQDQNQSVNIPAETEEGCSDISQLYNYQMLREQALQIVQKKREVEQMVNLKDLQQQQEQQQQKNNNNAIHHRQSKIQRGNFMQ